MTQHLGRSAVETARYLRVGIVGLAVLLAVSVLFQVISDGQLMGSISAYYYTPVRDVFVGVLVALGLSLIAVRGRDVEDVLLNLAGMLAAIVAFVPTPVDGGWFAYAPLGAGESTQYSSELRDDNSIWSLLVIGLIGVVFAASTSRRLAGRARTLARRGVAASATVVLGFGAWLVVGPDSFHEAAHYVAAVGMFGAFVIVARINAAATEDDEGGPVMAMLPAARRRAAYTAISWSMLGTVLVAGALGLLQLADIVPIPHWLFWVETVLLGLFAGFWLLQTVEYWRDGSPR